MRKLTSSLMGGLLLLVAATAFGQNNTNPPGDTLMRALLEEMRLLRTAMERNAAADLRSRLLLERMRHQQDIVRELQRETDNRRMEEESRIEPFEWEAETMEARMREAIDPATKRQIEQQMAGMKKRQEMMERHRQRMEVRARQQEQRLVEETARLRGIEDELQRLAATLATP